MPKERTVVGIDIGSTKIATVIAQVKEEGGVSVIGASKVPSSGIKKAVVVDIDEAVDSIAAGLESTERMAGVTVSSAFVSVGGKHLASQNSHGVVAVGAEEEEIDEEDVARVTEAARAVSLPSTREIIHVLPRGFVVDSQEGVKDPVGMSGIRLEVETNIISGAATVMRNLVKCVQRVGVDVEELVFCGLASSEAVLTDTEKELGVVLLDIGGGTTQVCIFSGGSPTYASVLPIGGQNITNDLAVGLRVSLEESEKIKLKLTDDLLKSPADEVDISELGMELKSIPRALILNIIEARLSEIFSMVGLEIKNSGLQGNLPAGLVITGGGAATVGAKETAKKILRMPQRIGNPAGVSGLIDEISDPSSATAIGLLLYGASLESGAQFNLPSLPGVNLAGTIKKVIEWGKSFIPG